MSRNCVHEKIGEMGRTIDLRRAGRTEEALAVVNTDIGRSLMVEIRSDLDRIQQRATRAIDVEYEESQALDKLLLLVTLGALGVVLVLGVLAMRINRRAIAAR